METSPGYKTTEFWLAVASSLVSVVALWYGLSPSDTATVQEAVKNAVINLGALAATAALIWRYIASRENLKAVHLIARARSSPGEEGEEDEKPRFGFSPKHLQAGGDDDEDEDEDDED